MLTRSAKIWLVFAILLCSATTVLNLMEGRIPSVVLAVIEIAALVVLLVPLRLLCPVLRHRRLRRPHRRHRPGSGHRRFGHRVAAGARTDLGLSEKESADHGLSPLQKSPFPRQTGVGEGLFAL